MSMSSVDDVFQNSEMLLDALVRMPPFDNTEGMGQVGSFPGLVPSTYHAARQVRDDSAATLAIVKETNALLSAVNGETLQRIGVVIDATQQVLGQLSLDVSAGRANTDQTLGRIEENLQKDMDVQLNVHDGLQRASAKLDTIVGQLQQDVTDLNTKLDALTAAVQALPQK
jgi:hypothetical protein